MIPGQEKVQAIFGEVFGNDRIGVEKEDIFACRLFQRLVIGAGEPGIFGIQNPFHSREQRAEKIHAAVGRVVIHDDDLCVQAFQAFAYRLETKLQKVWYAVVDDNDGEDHGEAANYDFFWDMEKN